MTHTSKTIIFFGTDDFSLTTLRRLIDNKYNIAAVVTKPDSKSGRGQTLQMPSVKKLAIEYNIPVWQPSKVTDINNDILSLNASPIGVLVSYGKIIPESTINLFSPGIINIHPSLLPIYRGPSPIESAIINGDKITGVSIMKLSAGMDDGPVYRQISYDLSGEETQPELYDIFSKIGSEELLKILPSIISGEIQPTPQQNDKAIYCKLINKGDAWLDMNKITAIEAERAVRAHINFPKTKIAIDGINIIIVKAHVENEQKTTLDILCSDHKYLSIDELIAPSGRRMSAKDFVNGYLLN